MSCCKFSCVVSLNFVIKIVKYDMTLISLAFAYVDRKCRTTNGSLPYGTVIFFPIAK